MYMIEIYIQLGFLKLCYPWGEQFCNERMYRFLFCFGGLASCKQLAGIPLFFSEKWFSKPVNSQIMYLLYDEYLYTNIMCHMYSTSLLLYG